MGGILRFFAAERGKMSAPVKMVEIWRGAFEESVHLGHAVICDGKGDIVEAWGDPLAVILPRSSAKMIQALPLVEGGYSEALSPQQLALLCASHQGAEIHSTVVLSLLSNIGLGADDLRCGPEEPRDRDARDRLIRENDTPCRVHNNCSGKHAGFLMLEKHLGGGAEYVEPDHPVQRAVRQVFEEVTGMPSPGFGIDGCSAPNFATTLAGLARAMGRFAAARETDARGRAMVRLRDAMMAAPEMVAGEGRACTNLMRAMPTRAAVKTGAEAVYVAICPDIERGIAVKITDGATRASEAIMTALLSRLGLLAPDHPTARQYTFGPITNLAGLETGHMRVVI